MPPLVEYTRDEIKKHNTPQDAWVIQGGFVIDVTRYLSTHPGGAGVIVDYLGCDIDDAMEDADHSPFAYSVLKELVVGKVKGAVTKERFDALPSDLRGFDLEEIRGVVDFKKPTLAQVASIGRKYWPWIKTKPICNDNTIFTWNWMEALSHYPWWYIFIMWTPVVAYNLVQDSLEGTTVATAAASFGLGAFSWTFFEYLLHRFIFHWEVSSNPGNVFHYFAHGIHHLTPSDTSRLTFPPFFAVFVGYLFYLFWCVATPAALSVRAAFSGFVVGYVLYDTAHYYLHHAEFRNPFLKRLKTLHLSHHFKNDAMNYGVTSPLWDLVFGTYDPVSGNASEGATKRH